MKKYNNYTIDECRKTVDPLIAKGATVYMKFTCAKCWSRQTCEEPNTFYATATCGECGHVTDVLQDGCNYLLMMPV